MSTYWNGLPTLAVVAVAERLCVQRHRMPARRIPCAECTGDVEFEVAMAGLKLELHADPATNSLRYVADIPLSLVERFGKARVQAHIDELGRRLTKAVLGAVSAPDDPTSYRRHT